LALLIFDSAFTNQRLLNNLTKTFGGIYFVMARMKKTAGRDIQNAKKRLAGMKAIDPALKINDEVTVEIFETAINKAVTGIDVYNGMLSTADNKLNEIDGDIKTMNDLSTRVLSGGESKFGKDSSEYEMLGGTRTSERKKPGKKIKETP
jgi:hypothetical protein